MKLSIKLLVILLSLMLVIISHAQLTEQSENNECFEGGMLDGQCSITDADGDGVLEQADIDWMFECGYYLAQVDNGDLENEDVPLDGCSKQERVIPRPKKIIERIVCLC